MFRPRTMVEVDILLLQRDLPAALRGLAEAGIIHLHRMETSGRQEKSVAGPDLSLSDRYVGFRELLLRLNEDLGGTGASAAILAIDDFSSWEAWATGLHRSLARLRQRQEELGRFRDYLGCLAFFLRQLERVDGDLGELRDLQFRGLQLALLPVASLGDGALLAAGTLVYPLKRKRGKELVVFLTKKRQQTALAQRIAETGGVPLPLPQVLSGSFSGVLQRIRSLYKKVRRQLARLNLKVAELRRRNEALLLDRLHTIAAEIHLLSAGEQFGFTHRTVAIAGWVPQRRYRELEDILRRTCGERYIVHHAVARGGQTPVLLANPWLVRPFQRMLAVLGTPAYSEIEPTPLLAIGFVVLFGMMFGDLGHGLLLLTAGLLLRRSPRFRDHGAIVAQVGLFSAFFGLLFGSFFGHEDQIGRAHV